MSNLGPARRTLDATDKAVATEARLGTLVNRLSGMGLATNASTFTGGDANTWNVGWSPRILTSDATACSTIAQSSTGLTMPVGIGTYAWDGDIWIVSSSTNDAYITMSGPANSDFVNLTVWEQLQAGAVAAGFPSNLVREQTTIGTNTGLNTAGMNNGSFYTCRLFGYATFTAAGTLQVSQASSANATSFTVKKGSVLRVYPQT